MIVWCREHEESWQQINSDWVDLCSLCYPLVPRPTPEYNTVDLAELQRERKRQTFARTAQFLLEGNR